MAGDEPGDPEPSRWRRRLRALVAAWRWALDVLRGHARSRHLYHREK